MKINIFNLIVLIMVTIGIIAFMTMSKAVWFMFYIACGVSTISAFTVNLETVSEE